MKEMQKSRIDKLVANYGHYIISGNTLPNPVSSSHTQHYVIWSLYNAMHQHTLFKVRHIIHSWGHRKASDLEAKTKMRSIEPR